MKAWNYITIDFEGQVYSLIVQIIVKADRGKAISRSKTQFLMVLINTKQNLPFLGSLWGIELRFSLSHHVELKFFLTISSCSNKARNNFPFRRYQNLISSNWYDLFTNCTIFCFKSHLFPSQWGGYTKNKTTNQTSRLV